MFQCSFVLIHPEIYNGKIGNDLRVIGNHIFKTSEKRPVRTYDVPTFFQKSYGPALFCTSIRGDNFCSPLRALQLCLHIHLFICYSSRDFIKKKTSLIINQQITFPTLC